MYIINIKFEDWYEEYIGDTVNKKLLRVKSFQSLCDTIPINHPQPDEPLYIVSCGIQSYTFFYNDNILVKISENTRKLNYHMKENVFIAVEPSGLRAVSADSFEHKSIRNVWLYGNKYISRFKELLKE